MQGFGISSSFHCVLFIVWMSQSRDAELYLGIGRTAQISFQSFSSRILTTLGWKNDMDGVQGGLLRTDPWGKSCTTKKFSLS